MRLTSGRLDGKRVKGVERKWDRMRLTSERSEGNRESRVEELGARSRGEVVWDETDKWEVTREQKVGSIKVVEARSREESG